MYRPPTGKPWRFERSIVAIDCSNTQELKKQRGRAEARPLHFWIEMGVRGGGITPDKPGEKEIRIRRQIVLASYSRRYMVMPLMSLGKKSVDFWGMTSLEVAIFMTCSTSQALSKKETWARPESTASMAAEASRS